MTNEERRQKIMSGPGPIHGAAEAREDVEGVNKGTIGAITAYLPNEETFAVMWPNKSLVTYKCSEEEFNNQFKLSAPEEILWQ